MTERLEGWRNARRGPNNSGHRPLLRWLHAEGLSTDTAKDRVLRQGYSNHFLQSLGLAPTPQSPPNFYCNGKDEYVLQEVEAVQGTFAGGQTIVLTLVDPACLAVSHVTRRDGWVHKSSPLPVAVFTAPGLIDLVLLQLREATFHCRILCNGFSDFVLQSLESQCPGCHAELGRRRIVVEMSAIPVQWETTDLFRSLPP